MVAKAIETIRKRRGIKKNKSRRFQSYQLIAHLHELRQRTQLPMTVIQLVRDAFPDKNDK